MRATADRSSASSDTAAGERAAVRPSPTDDEAAAIAAALQLIASAGITPAHPEASSWRFSGRWWTQPVPLRRPRPWT